MSRNCFWLMSMVTIGLMAFNPAAADDGGSILFRNARIDVGHDWIGIPTAWRATNETSGYSIVHCTDRINQATRVKIEEFGAIVSYAPHNAYLVKLEASALDQVRNLPEVDWVGVYQPYLKVDRALLDPNRKTGSIKMRLTLFGGEPFETAETVITRFKGEVLNLTDQPHRRRIAFTVAGDVVDEVVKSLAFLPEVEWIQRYPEYKMCNDYTQWVCQSGPYGEQATPLYDHGVKGEGQLVGVMDTGADADMCYFYDSVQGLIVPNAPPDFDQRKVVAYIGPSEYANDFDTHGHGTHTGGTIAGDNFANPGEHDTGDGIALLAKLIIQDYGDGGDVYPPDDEYAAHQAVYDIGGRVHSNSWGWPYEAGVYLDDCQEVDQFIWDNPKYGIVYAAGNEGPYTDSIRAPGTSKNVITAGATQSGAADPENNADFSSHGPTDDGRRKPDVTMPGYDIISAANDYSPSTFNCSTTQMSGTSMATPGVAGCAALIRDYFMQGFYPLGAPDPSFAFEPSAALIKGIMINSGVNMTGEYTADDGAGHADIPSHGQGWGRVTLDTALFFMGDQRLLYLEDEEIGLGTGENMEFFVAVNDPVEPLEITLVWSDYPSTPSASINLVNDLDLTVTIGSDVYKGNVYADGYSIIGGDYDRLNNVECVQIQTPPVGSVVVRIEGFNVPQGPQPFALVVSGALSFSDGVISLNSTMYPCDGSATITVSDADLANQGAQDVTVVSTEDPTGEIITLTETSPNSGVFQGSVQFTTDAPGVGEILVVHGAGITATYIDEDDGHGGINVPKTDVATIDCVEPVISNVMVQSISSSSALVTWETDEPCTSRVDFGIQIPPDEYVSNPSFTTTHEVQLNGISPCSDYYFSVTGSDRAGNVGFDDNSGAYYTFTTLAIFYLIEENMDDDPQWTISGGNWAWGQPTGGGYYNYDPTSGYTGANVYGYNLDGEYEDDMPEYTLTTSMLNCSAASGTSLSFYRWLGIESSWFDSAKVQISTNGVDWLSFWENPEGGTLDEAWTPVSYDISEYADGQPEVYIRWTMGPTDGSVTYCGWNIDDVVVSYEAPCNAPNLAVESHAIDDTTGDADGWIDSGETITMPVNLINYGLGATAVSATISTTNPNVTILNATTQFGDIPQYEVRPSQAPHFSFSVAATATDSEAIAFNLQWTSAEASGVVTIVEHIHAPDLIFHSYEIQEDAGGDGDGIVDPGEAVTMPVMLYNAGSDDAFDVTGELSVSPSAYVTIDDASADFGILTPHNIGYSTPPHFHFSTAPNTPDHTVATFTLTITDDMGAIFLQEFTVEITSSTFIRRYYFPLDTDPGWQTEDEWAWGTPAGIFGDPTSGATGQNVYGYNLNGGYYDDMPAYSLTSEPLDCSTFSNTEVRFQRWLGVESNYFDHAVFSVSSDGVNWTTIWENSEEGLNDEEWASLDFDISAYADGAPSLYLRWTMGPTDGSVTYCGWNIDDIEIWAAAGDENTPTPIATATRTPTQVPSYTPTPTTPPTLSPTPTNPPTHTPTRTPTNPPPTATPTTIPSVPPSATPECPESSITCELNQTTYHPDDHFKFEVSACNGESEDKNVEVYIILDVWGNYWFWPTWSQELSYELWTIPACDCVHEVILEFDWPSGAGSADSILFWTGMLIPGTADLFGTIANCEFDYEE